MLFAEPCTAHVSTVNSHRSACYTAVMLLIQCIICASFVNNREIREQGGVKIIRYLA
jgi:hypothetical protein